MGSSALKGRPGRIAAITGTVIVWVGLVLNILAVLVTLAAGLVVDSPVTGSTVVVQVVIAVVTAGTCALVVYRSPSVLGWVWVALITAYQVIALYAVVDSVGKPVHLEFSLSDLGWAFVAALVIGAPLLIKLSREK